MLTVGLDHAGDSRLGRPPLDRGGREVHLLGVRLVTGIRFYKAATNTGTHIGTLWTSTGTLLAQATFTSETASGWQQVNFATPVTISPNTTYVAAYLAPNGHYSATEGYFFSPPPTGGHVLSSPPLQATPASDTSINGLYSYSATSTFPSSTYQGTNYWVDVAFTPAAAPGTVTGVTATASSASANVSWTAPSTGGRRPPTPSPPTRARPQRDRWRSRELPLPRA